MTFSISAEFYSHNYSFTTLKSLSLIQNSKVEWTLISKTLYLIWEEKDSRLSIFDLYTAITSRHIRGYFSSLIFIKAFKVPFQRCTLSLIQSMILCYILIHRMHSSIYSFTSIEHSYIPGTMLETWVEQPKRNRLCLLGTHSAVGEARNISAACKVPDQDKGAKKQ